MLAFQAPPIHVTINLYVENLFVGEQPLPPPDPSPAVTNTPSCIDLLASYNAAAGQADTYERTTEAEFRGDPNGASGANNGCQIQAAVPLRN